VHSLALLMKHTIDEDLKLKMM